MSLSLEFSLFLDATDYPEITICPFPSYNQTAFTLYGYDNSFQYSVGNTTGGALKIFGWNGNDSTELEKIITDISLIKSVKQCPYTRIVFAEENRFDFRYVKVDMHLTGFKHPLGQGCLKSQNCLVPYNGFITKSGSYKSSFKQYR